MRRPDILNPANDRLDGGRSLPLLAPSTASGSLVAGRLEDVEAAFLVLSLREDGGACIATVIFAGFASVLRFVLDRHDEWVLGTGSDEWPVDEGGDEYWDCLGLVSDFMAGSQAERRQLNATLAGEYLAARAAA